MNTVSKLTGAAALAFAVAGCSDNPQDYGPQGNTSGLQPDNGVEAEVINLGELEETDYRGRIIKLEGDATTDKDDIFLFDLYRGANPSVRRGYGFSAAERISRQEAHNLIQQAYPKGKTPSFD